MTTAPFGVTISPRQTAVVESSPYSLVLLLPRESGVTAVVNVLTDIPDDTTAIAQLGAVGLDGRNWYDYLESQANIHIAALPYAPDSDDDTNAANAATALDALLEAEELAKLSSLPDLVLAPDLTGRATAASAVVTKLETVCADARVGAIAVVDAYHASSSPQADVTTWGTNNAGPDILAMTNQASVSGANLYGSVIAAGHICRFAGLRGVGLPPVQSFRPGLRCRGPVSAPGVLSGRR